MRINAIRQMSPNITEIRPIEMTPADINEVVRQIEPLPANYNEITITESSDDEPVGE